MFLSILQRKILGNRTAKPDLCLDDLAIPSNAISKTSCGNTLLTGPNLSKVFFLINESTFLNSLSVSPE